MTLKILKIKYILKNKIKNNKKYEINKKGQKTIETQNFF
jgi:hypothetical protein